MNHPLLLGIDFMSLQDAKLDFAKCRLYLKGKQVFVNTFHLSEHSLMKTVNNLCLPPQGESLISVATDDVIKPNQPYLVQPIKSLPSKRGIVGAATVAEMKDGTATLWVVNPHSNEIKLSAGFHISSVTLLHGEDIHKWSDETTDFDEGTYKHSHTVNTASKGGINPQSCTDDNEYITIAKTLGFDASELLTPEQNRKLLVLLGQNKDVFATNLKELGSTNIHKHVIDTGDSPPI